MKAEEFELIDGPEMFDLPVDFPAISDNRTLLYGYDCDKNTWHVYSQNGDVIVHVYDLTGTKRRDNVSQRAVRLSMLQSCVVPDKRLYPERCDYEFCFWLKNSGITLPFTTYDYSRFDPNADKYYGDL